MNKFTILKGNAVQEAVKHSKHHNIVLAHIVNCQKKMNSGIARTIKETFPQVYKSYMELEPVLGQTDIVKVSSKLKVANMYAQEYYGYDGKLYLDYDALTSCLDKLATELDEEDILVIPYKIGCGLAGGDWSKVSLLIKSRVPNTTYCYELS